MRMEKLVNLWLVAILGVALAAWLGGCTPTATDDDDAAGDDDDATGDDDDDDDGDPCEDPEQLRDDALENGDEILDGVELEESTPIADINEDLVGYHDQYLQVEGMAVEICASAGCWTMVVDPDGESLRLKVDDGAIDWRNFVEVGLYLVADGIFDKDGAHGPQLFVQDHGAMVGTINCY